MRVWSLLLLGAVTPPTVGAAPRYAMPAAVSRRLGVAERLGAADPDAPLMMTIVLRVRQLEALEALIAAQQQPGSPEYHRWLTPAEFAVRFAPLERSHGAVVGWLQQQGFTVQPGASRLRVDFSGSVAQVQRAFGVRMGHYRHRGRRVLANESAPLLPMEFAGLVGFVRLNTFPLAEPQVRLGGPGGTVNVMAPHDMYTAYDVAPVLAQGMDGTGQTIAVVARSDFDSGDVVRFQQLFGVPVHEPVRVFPGGSPGIGAAQGVCGTIRNRGEQQACIKAEETEVLLDVEWAGVMAPGATVLADISEFDVDAALVDVITRHPEAKIISMSFGGCERFNEDGLRLLSSFYAQAAAQGQTVLVASGDGGADGCRDGGAASVNALASDPNVTAVGGTGLDPGFNASGDATRYVRESAWNDVSGASGGGVSTLVAKPSYQAAPATPSDGARDQPDVALLASPPSPGYVIVVESRETIVGGTSVATPAWAGIVALLNQAARTDGAGALNYRLYALGRRQYAGQGPAVFNDVTRGDNNRNGVPGFGAGPGFDLVTGLGSPNVQRLVAAFAAPECTGDCNGDGAVTIDELLVGVNLALAEGTPVPCTAFDVNGDGHVTIDELVDAAGRALNGCAD